MIFTTAQQTDPCKNYQGNISDGPAINALRPAIELR
jgi:hypothetical protein